MLDRTVEDRRKSKGERLILIIIINISADNDYYFNSLLYKINDELIANFS